jgi:hypothetical protein
MCTYINFFICACIVIFFLISAIWLAIGTGSFLRFLDRCPKELFLATNRCAKTVLKLKTLHKKLKNRPIDTKDSKIQWIYFSGLCAKPEMYISPTKMRKNKYKHLKTTCHACSATVHVLIQMLLIYSAILRKYTYKHKYNVQLVLKYKFKKIP